MNSQGMFLAKRNYALSVSNLFLFTANEMQGLERSCGSYFYGFDCKPRKRRTIFTAFQTNELENAFAMDNYPHKIEMNSIAMALNLDYRTVRVRNSASSPPPQFLCYRHGLPIKGRRSGN